MILINDYGTFEMRQATYYDKKIEDWYVSNEGFLYNPSTNKYKFGRDNVKNIDLHQRVSIRHKQYYLHRIVAEAWVENPNKERNIIVRHLDDNPRNNFYKNLMWGTSQENTFDAIRNGKIVYDKNRKYTKNENHHMALLTNEQVLLIIDDLNSLVPISVIAKKYNVSRGIIDHIYAGRSWKDLTYSYLPFPYQKVYNPPSEDIKNKIIKYLNKYPNAKPLEIMDKFKLEKSNSIKGFIGQTKRKINKNKGSTTIENIA